MAADGLTAKKTNLAQRARSALSVRDSIYSTLFRTRRTVGLQQFRQHGLGVIQLRLDLAHASHLYRQFLSQISELIGEHGEHFFAAHIAPTRTRRSGSSCLASLSAFPAKSARSLRCDTF